MRWIPYAMVRVALFFSAGIILALAFPGRFVDESSVVLVFLATLYPLARAVFRKSRGLKLTTGFAGLCAILVAGYVKTSLHDQSKWNEHITRLDKPIHAYEIRITASAEERRNSWRQRGEISKVWTGNGWQTATGRVNLYWRKSELDSVFIPGDILVVNGTPSTIDAPLNPDQFDMRKHLASKNVFHQQFLRTHQYSLATPSDRSGLVYFAHSARMWSIRAISEYIGSTRESGIVVALVLGVTDGIDEETQSAYAASGTMHVLAVSGLHVSIIYGILLFFLKPLNKTTNGQWLVAIVSLVLMWAYALLTGLSPSVLRAVTMFSFIVLAKPIGKNTNIYNTLAASAFFLLLYDPYLILSVGFQLSYLAVLGIVYLQRPIYNLWEPRSRVVSWMWQLSSVTIAAQISTLPLGLLHFHQFPVYFLLANLVVIPGSFVVLIGGILLILISPFAWVATWLGVALEYFVKWLNAMVFLVERLPGTQIDGIFITPVQSILLFVIILFVVLLFRLRELQYLCLSLFGAIAFTTSSWIHYLDVFQKKEFAVYYVPGHTAIEFFESGRSIWASDSTLSIGSIGFNIEPHRLTRGITSESVEVSRLIYSPRLKLWNWKGVEFLWIGDENIAPRPGFPARRAGGDSLPGPRLPPSPMLRWTGRQASAQPPILTVDYIIVSNNALQSVSELSKWVSFNKLIFDSSNSQRYCDRMLNKSSGHADRCYWVLKDGAFTVTL